MTIYRTEVLYIPPTPLGLLPGHWTTEHSCTTCHQRIAADKLIAHAQTHDQHPAIHHRDNANA